MIIHSQLNIYLFNKKVDYTLKQRSEVTFLLVCLVSAQALVNLYKRTLQEIMRVLIREASTVLN